MDKKYITNSAKETQKLGQKLAKEILIKKRKGAFILALIGNLGGGKTTFLQGFAEGIGTKEKILSPTFVIQKRFSACAGRSNFYHIDCYRLNKPEDILELGWKEIIKNTDNIIAVEWPEKIKKFLPKNTITVEFAYLEKNKRLVVFRN